MKRLIEILATGLRDSSGNLLANGQVTFYEKESTTPKTVFSDWDLENPHPNPATLSATGTLTAYVDGRIKINVANSSGTYLYSIDHIGTEDADVAETATSLIAGDGIETEGLEVSVSVDDATIEVASNQLRVKDDAVSTAKIQDGAITPAKLATANWVESSSSGSFSSSASAYVTITNHSISVTTNGRPVMVMLTGDGAGSSSLVSFNSGASSSAALRFKRDSTVIMQQGCQGYVNNNPAGAFFHIDQPAAGTYTYSAEIHPGGASAAVTNVKLVVFEL